MRLVLKVPALETVGRMYSSFLPKGKENPQGQPMQPILSHVYFTKTVNAI